MLVLVWHGRQCDTRNEASFGLAAIRSQRRELEVLRRSGAPVQRRDRGNLAHLRAHVKSHIGRIFTMLGLRDRAAAVVYAFDSGLVVPGQRDQASTGGPGT